MDTEQPKRKRGRPNKGKRAYAQISLTLHPDVKAQLDRLADRREQTGKKTSRLDLIREAIAAYLETVHHGKAH